MKTRSLVTLLLLLLAWTALASSPATAKKEENTFVSKFTEMKAIKELVSHIVYWILHILIDILFTGL